MKIITILRQHLKGMSKKFIEDEKKEEENGNTPCRVQCFEQTTNSKESDLTEVSVTGTETGVNSGSDFCLKTKRENYSCKEDYIRNNPVCYDQCGVGGDGPQASACVLTIKQKIPCLKMLLEEERWKRRVDALDTAIEIYVEKGYLHNDKNVYVQAGPKGCTTEYQGTVFDGDDVPTEETEWERIAVYPIFVQLDISSDVFNIEDKRSPELRIKQDDAFYLRFDGQHRMWYTMDDPDDVILPEMDSAAYTAAEVKSTVAEHQYPNGTVIRHNLKV